MTNPPPGQQPAPHGQVVYGARPSGDAQKPQQAAPSPQIVIPGLSGYSNLELLAHGSTAVVYRAVQDRLKRQVAIKVLLVDDVMTTLENVEFELETLVQLSQMAHIVSIIDTGFTDTDQPFIVMEYCEGGSYAQIMKDHGPLPVDDVIEVGVKIGEALDAAHDVGIIHRDVKPPNILRSRFGPALTDFGIAYAGELSRTTTFQKLTPHHASPETLLQQDQSGKSDLYSLASTMWNLLAGTPPFKTPGSNPEEFRRRVLTQPVPRVPRDDVPEWLQQELARAMAKRPAHRHSSALEFSEMLRYRWRNDGQAPVSPGWGYNQQMYHAQSAPLPATPHPPTPAQPYTPQLHGQPHSPQPQPQPQTSPAVVPQHPSAPQQRSQYVPTPQHDEDDESAWQRAVEPLRERPWIAVVGAGTLALLLVVVAVFVLSGGGEEDPDQKGGGPSSSAEVSTDPIPLAELKPSEVRISSDSGGEVELTWDPPRRGSVESYLIYGTENGGDPTPLKSVQAGTVQSTVRELNAEAEYCFTLVALFDTTKDPALTKRVQADPVCTTRN